MMVPRDGDDSGCFFFLWVINSKLGGKSIWHDIISWIYQVWWWGSAKLRWSYYEDSSSVFILFIGMELPKEGRLWAYQKPYCDSSKICQTPSRPEKTSRRALDLDLKRKIELNITSSASPFLFNYSTTCVFLCSRLSFQQFWAVQKK